MADPSSDSPAEVEARPVGRIRGSVVAFEVGNFRILWAGRASSNMARQMRVFLRAWMVWEMTDSPFLLGFVTSSLAWPMLFMPFIGGFMADKIDRRLLLKVTESLLVVVWAAMAVLIILDLIHWWHFVVSSVLSGVIQSIGRPGHQALLGSIVDKRRLSNAATWDNVADSWPRVAGPAVAAILIGVIGEGWRGILFASTAAMQLFTVITVFLLDWNPEEQRAKQRGSGERGSFFEGFKYVWNEKVLFGLVSIGVTFSVIGGAAGFMLPIFADVILGEGAAGFMLPIFPDAMLGEGEGASGLGYLMTVSTLGGAVGALTVVSLSNFGRRGYLLLAVAVLNTGLLMAFAKSDIFMLTMVIVFGMGMAQVMFRAMRIVAMQVLAPDDLRGRVMSFQTSIQGMSFIGVLLLGGVAEVLKRPGGVDLGFVHLGGSIASGVSDTVMISAIAYGVVTLVFFAVLPALRNFR